MNTKLHISMVEFKRGIRSSAFLSQILLMLFWMVINVLPVLTNAQSLRFSCWQSLLSQATTYEFYFADLVLIISTVSFAWSFLEDCDSHFLRTVYQRISLREYCTAKILAVSAVSFFASSVSILFFVLLSQFLPLAAYDNLSGYENEYLPFVARGQSLLYLLARFLVTGLSCSLAAVVALAISAWIDNLFVVVLFPFILYQFIELILTLMDSRNSIASFLFRRPLNDPTVSLFLTIAGMSVSIAIAGQCFYYGIAKGRENI